MNGDIVPHGQGAALGLDAIGEHPLNPFGDQQRDALLAECEAVAGKEHGEYLYAVALATALLDLGCVPARLAFELRDYVDDTTHALSVASAEAERRETG